MKSRKIHDESYVWSTAKKNRKRSTNLMLMLGLNETIDQLAMANCVHWYVLRRDGHVLRKALDL